MRHREWLLQALAHAREYAGRCAPNPAVGAVLVHADKIIATGVHKGCGTLHAERDLLMHFSTVIEQMILYVTLEPCSHQGRTPACTDIILESGIKQVIFAHKDPNPTVSGNGQSVLEAAGIRCEQVVVPEIERFYQSYDDWLMTGRPYVTAKIALSRDEKIAGPGGKTVQITGSEAKALTHQLRREQDAILTSSRTVLADDPQLNVRLAGEVQAKPVYVLDRQARFPIGAQLLQTAAKVTVLHGESAAYTPIEAVQYQVISENQQGLDWRQVLSFIGAEGVQRLWVEAGAACFASLYLGGWLQEIYFYQSKDDLGESALPGFIGDLSLKQVLADSRYQVTEQWAGEDRVWHLVRLG